MKSSALHGQLHTFRRPHRLLLQPSNNEIVSGGPIPRRQTVEAPHQTGVFACQTAEPCQHTAIMTPTPDHRHQSLLSVPASSHTPHPRLETAITAPTPGHRHQSHLSVARPNPAPHLRWQTTITAPTPPSSKPFIGRHTQAHPAPQSPNRDNGRPAPPPSSKPFIGHPRRWLGQNLWPRRPVWETLKHPWCLRVERG